MRIEEIIALSLPLGIVAGLLMKIYETESWIWPALAGIVITTIIMTVDKAMTKRRKKKEKEQ